jgi:hypothetical protein
VSPTRIAKRDGREVPFDEQKIRSAVARALAAVGEDDPDLPAEVAVLVRLTLEQRHAAGSADDESHGRLAHIEEIQDLVERALIELGRATVAKAYIVYRDRRAQIRDALTVHEAQPRPRGIDVTVEDSQTVSRWSKGRIVAALMGEGDLPRATAEKVAARVETRVFELGLRRISTGLLRELVDSELVELGLEGALRRQTSIGVPLHDLRALLADAPPSPDPLRAANGSSLAARGLEARVSAAVLRRHALFELLPDAVVERHLAGDLEVVGLDALQRPLLVGLPCELLLARAEVRAADAFALLEPLARALGATSQCVVLEDAGDVIAALSGRTRAAGGDEGLDHWISALTATARAAGRRLDLSGVEGSGGHAARRRAQLARLVLALDAAPPSAWLPRLFVEEDALEGLLLEREQDLDAALERLLAGGRLVPTWSAHGERVVGPGCVRQDGERTALSCGAALALNLPRLALRAGPWREDRLLESLAGLVASGAEALAAVSALQQRAPHGVEIAGVRARAAFAVVPVGLREALACLGDGEVRPEQGARLMGFLSDHLRRLAQRFRIALVLTPFYGEQAAERFARLDSAAPQFAQRQLFGSGPALEPGRAYSHGWRLSPAPGFVPWAAEAELLRTVAPGVLHPLPEERARTDDLPLHQAWQRFARLRREPMADETVAQQPSPGLFDDAFDLALHPLPPLR